MYDILEVFHWDRFGYGGSFLYQFGAYMMLATLLNFYFQDCGIMLVGFPGGF